MTDTYTPNKSLALQATGSNNNSWGSDLNNNVFTPVDTALGGLTYIVITGVAAGAYTLTAAQYRPPNIWFAGSLSANLTYVVPSGVGGMWSVFCNTSGPYTITFASASGSNVVVPQGQRSLVVCDPVFGGMAFAQTKLDSANPVALVGTTAVNGTLGTFMTSDSAPAINQGMSPTWTGIHTFDSDVYVNSTLVLNGSIGLEAGGYIDGVSGNTFVATVATGNNTTLAASTAFVQDTLVASPALQGNPTATTQSATNNSTRIATTAFVQAVIAALPVNAGNNTNGSVSIGGLIINYGQLTTPGSSPVTVNYTTAYTTAVYAVVPYLIGANQTYFVSAGFGSSLSSWTLNFGASAQVVGWIAIGV